MVFRILLRCWVVVHLDAVLRCPVASLGDTSLGTPANQGTGDFKSSWNFGGMYSHMRRPVCLRERTMLNCRRAVNHAEPMHGPPGIACGPMLVPGPDGAVAIVFGCFPRACIGKDRGQILLDW